MYIYIVEHLIITFHIPRFSLKCTSPPTRKKTKGGSLNEIPSLRTNHFVSSELFSFRVYDLIKQNIY